MSQLLATPHGIAPNLSGVATIFRVEQYRDLWIRQPVKLYVMACDELTRVHELGLLEAA